MVIEKFLLENFLTLNCDKCDILFHSSRNSTPDITANVGSHSLKPVTTSKCLGTWCTSDLISENMAKTHRAFFAYGSFHGDLNPLSTRGIIEVCVMPLLLFVCESWYLTDTGLDDLERFHCKIGRKILHLSTFTPMFLYKSDSTGLVLEKEYILIKKLNYLRKLVKIMMRSSVPRYFMLLLFLTSHN